MSDAIDDLAAAYHAGAPRIEWGVRSKANYGREGLRPCFDREDAQRWVREIYSFYDPGDWEIEPHIVCRTVTAWTSEEQP